MKTLIKYIEENQKFLVKGNKVPKQTKHTDELEKIYQIIDTKLEEIFDDDLDYQLFDTGKINEFTLEIYEIDYKYWKSHTDFHELFSAIKDLPVRVFKLDNYIEISYDFKGNMRERVIYKFDLTYKNIQKNIFTK